MAEPEKNSKEANGEEKKRGSGGLQHIRETLSKLPSELAGKQSEAGRASLEIEKITGDCECQECGKTFSGEIMIYHSPGTTMLPGEHYPLVPKPRPPREFRPPYCPDCQEKIEAEAKEQREKQLAEARKQEVALWRAACGMSGDLVQKTFDTFDKSRQVDAYDEALAWAKGFNLEAPTGYPSLIFYSATPGLGKTHLMVGIGDYILRNWQGVPGRRRSPIVFVKGPRLVRRIRYTYDIREDDYSHEREEEVYREITGVPLLLLDDVGKETPSRFTRETYWYIIDERVTSGLPVIITSRLPLEGENSLEQLMGIDTVDRLYGMTRGEVIEMTGQSYRRDQAVP